MQFWNELEGRVIENRYPLRRLLRSEGRSAWFETQAQDGGEVQAATISLTESLTDADEVTARLQAAQNLKHPCLVEIRRIGRAQLDQTLFVYAVMESTDQTLSDVLRDRTLSKEEARQVAETLTGALTAIHQQGLTHGRVEPASVLAVGEAVKLRSDCLQSPGATRAGDVAGLGATLFQAFTQRKASSADDAQINRIPAPFGEIVRNSLSARWGLAQIAAVLQPPGVQSSVPQAATSLPTPSAAMPMPVPTGTTEIGIASPVGPATPAKPPAAQSEMASPAQSPVQAPQDEEEPAPAPSRRVALYVVLVVALAVLLGWLIARLKAHPHTPPRNAITNPAPAPLPQATSPAAQSARPKPSAAIPAPIRPASQAAVAAPGSRKTWRVVAYTYHHQDQAQHKADEINHAHSGLQAQVFNPRGDPNHYLVVLGSGMDSHDAFQMRDKAIRAGLAADTYVQGFSE